MLRADKKLDLPTILIAQHTNKMWNVFFGIKHSSLMECFKSKIGGMRPYLLCLTCPLKNAGSNIVNHSRINAFRFHFRKIINMILWNGMLGIIKFSEVSKLYFGWESF